MTDANEEKSRSAAETQPTLESHRAYVREIDRTFANIYGFGGGSVLIAALLVWVALVLPGLLSLLPAGVLAITAGLIGLAVLRRFVKNKGAGLKVRVLGYCATNDIDPHLLREYYAQDGLYPYFDAALTADNDPAITDSTSEE